MPSFFVIKTYIMGQINFTGNTYKKTKQEIKREILQATKSSPRNRKEIARVFQMANRRIQNIERSGLLSPAVSALNKGEITGYTKFGMSHDWATLKTEYAKAIGFLRQPTGTLTGLREYNNHIKKTYDLTDDEFNLMSKSLNNKLSSISDSNFVERYLMRYKDFTGELESVSRDISSQLESDAIRLERALEASIEQKAQNIVDFQDDMEKAMKRMLDSFKNFKL